MIPTSFNENIIKDKLKGARQLLNNSVDFSSQVSKNRSIVVFEKQLNRKIKRSRNYSDVKQTFEEKQKWMSLLGAVPNNHRPGLITGNFEANTMVMKKLKV